MITLRKIAFEFRKMMAGGDPGPDFHITEAYAVLLARQGLQALLKPILFGAVDADDRSNPAMFIVPYEVSVQGSVGHQYLDLPEFYEWLPFNRGLYAVAPIQEPTRHYIPRHNPGTTYNLDCADVEGQKSYYVEGYRVFLDKEEQLGKLLVKLLIPAPDSITEDASLPIYPSQQYDLLRLMRALWENTPIQDKIVDNNKDIGTTIPR